MAQGFTAEPAVVLVLAGFVAAPFVPSAAGPEILYSARNSFPNY